MNAFHSFSLKNSRVFVGAVFIVALSTASLKAQQIRTDYDHHADFGRFHTFSIYKLQASDPLVEQRLRDDLTQNFSTKGGGQS